MPSLKLTARTVENAKRRHSAGSNIGMRRFPASGCASQTRAPRAGPCSTARRAGCAG
jgi:hypothetical protein